MSGQKYEFDLSEPFFSLVCVRGKDIHSSINKGKWKDIQPGDIVTFYNNESKKVRKVDVRVVEKNEYPTFRLMLKSEGLKRIFPNFDNIDQGVLEFFKNINPSEEEEFHVSSIRYNVIEDYPEGWSNTSCVIS